MRIDRMDRIVVLFIIMSTWCYNTMEGTNNNQPGNKRFHRSHQAWRAARSNAKNQNSRVPRHPQLSFLENLRRSPGPRLFDAINNYIGGGLKDTFTAYRNLSRLVQGAFISTGAGGTNATAAANATSFTLRQALTLLGRNLRGLRRLFDTEFVKALNESDKTVMEFGAELKNSARPFFEINFLTRNVSKPDTPTPG